MTGLLLDTDVLVDSLRGARRLIVGDAPIAYSVVTLCELFAGDDTDEDVVRATLSPFVAIRIDPDLHLAHNSLGEVLKSQGKLPEAKAHFEQALRIKPHDATAQQNLATTEAALQDRSPYKSTPH